VVINPPAGGDLPILLRFPRDADSQVARSLMRISFGIHDLLGGSSPGTCVVDGSTVRLRLAPPTRSQSNRNESSLSAIAASRTVQSYALRLSSRTEGPWRMIIR
jgi:hypothetical protein